jgi:hypothetical protein
VSARAAEDGAARFLLSDEDLPSEIADDATRAGDPAPAGGAEHPPRAIEQPVG